MYAGRVAEYGTREDIYYKAHHPYTWGLLQSIARLDQPKVERLRPIQGLPPSLIFVPPGCPFHPRCPYVMDVCKEEVPPLMAEDGKHAGECQRDDAHACVHSRFLFMRPAVRAVPWLPSACRGPPLPAEPAGTRHWDRFPGRCP
jgi:oligopeptide/dipeptide ABC transporter ATP-binding protein